MNTRIDAGTFLKASTALLSKKGKVGYRGSIGRATAAFPLHVLAGVEAFAEYSQETRSKVIAVLTETGLRLVVEGLRPDALKEVEALTDSRIRALLLEHSEEGEI
jgi:hypothetical protein